MSDLAYNLGFYSKSSPSKPFQFKRPRTQSIPVNSPTIQEMTNNKSNLAHVPCKFFKQGTCTAGANCTFSHTSDLSSESAVCKYFIKGNCKFGTKCALLHTMSHYGTSAGTTGSKTVISDTFRRNVGELSFINDPFASSAPAVSLFGQQLGEPSLWGQSPRSHRDLIGLHSSPRESSDLLSNSPYLNNGYFSNGSFSIPLNQDHIYDLNDAMLPSSLNDLFTPTELHARRLRQQEDTVSLTSNDWKVPFLTKNDYMSYEDKMKNSTTSAINIPGGNTNHESMINNSNYLQDDPISLQHDDEVQFFMEDDEVIPNDHMNIDMTTTQAFRNQIV